MTGTDDDEALSWAGGRDPSHYETPEPKAPKPSKEPGSTKQPAPSKNDVASEPQDGDDLPPAMSAAVLVSLGILGGIYLLYTVGWFISWQRFLYASADELELIAFHVQQILAILAPALWFTTALWLTRERKPAVRLIWLVFGAIVLIPWSFVLGS